MSKSSMAATSPSRADKPRVPLHDVCPMPNFEGSSRSSLVTWDRGEKNLFDTRGDGHVSAAPYAMNARRNWWAGWSSFRRLRRGNIYSARMRGHSEARMTDASTTHATARRSSVVDAMTDGERFAESALVVEGD